jgi:hypothetical protein
MCGKHGQTCGKLDRLASRNFAQHFSQRVDHVFSLFGNKSFVKVCTQDFSLRPDCRFSLPARYRTLGILCSFALLPPWALASKNESVVPAPPNLWRALVPNEACHERRRAARLGGSGRLIADSQLSTFHALARSIDDRKIGRPGSLVGLAPADRGTTCPATFRLNPS